MGVGVSDWGQSVWLAGLFGVIEVPPGYWIALASDEPGPAADGTTLADLEPGSGDDDPTLCGYARQWYPADASSWSTDDGYLTNLLDIVFPLPVTDWGYLSHYVLCNAADDGDIYAWGAFANPQQVTTGYLMTIPAGGLVVSLSSLEDSIAV